MPGISWERAILLVLSSFWLTLELVFATIFFAEAYRVVQRQGDWNDLGLVLCFGAFPIGGVALLVRSCYRGTVHLQPLPERIILYPMLALGYSFGVFILVMMGLGALGAIAVHLFRGIPV